MNRILRASEGKVFAYKDKEENLITLGSVLYLGINDDPSRYFEIDAKIEKEEEVIND